MENFKKLLKSFRKNIVNYCDRADRYYEEDRLSFIPKSTLDEEMIIDMYESQCNKSENLLKDLKVLREDIQNEIKSRPKDKNIGKLDCLRRLDYIIEKYESEE